MTTPQVAQRQLTRRTRFVVVDVETTNADDGKHVVSIGVHQWRVDPTASQPTPAPVHWYVDPGDLPIENTRIHGITRALLDEKKAQPFATVLPRLTKALTPRRGERVVLVAHYARFDVGVLHREYARAGQVLPDVEVLDTWALAHWLDVGTTKRNLPAMLAYYGLPVTSHHDAAADAADTAELLRRLLHDAAGQLVTDLAAPHPVTRREPVLRRTGDYDPAPADRGTRAARRSRYTFVERPAEHQTAHNPLHKSPTPSQITAWLDEARTCVDLRCPALPRRVDAVRAAQDTIADAFLTDWTTHQAAGEDVSANTALGAAIILLPKVIAPADAAAWFAAREAALRACRRCGDGHTGPGPFDACPDCRADRACPADMWPSTVAMLLLGAGRNFNARNSKSWLVPDGRLASLVDTGQADIAGQAAWLLYEMLTNQRPDDAAALLTLANDLGLTHPRLALATARSLEITGDRPGALAIIDAALLARADSTDRGWTDLLAYRDAVTARHAAASTAESPVRRQREGHSAPATRPDRRRFQLTAHAADETTARPSKPRSRSRRAKREGR